MNLRNLFSFLICLLFLNSVFSQGIRGRITNFQGEVVPFATIYVPEISTGTTSNIDGNYELKLPEGNWKVLFQYLGYKTQSREVSIGKAFQEINIGLENQNYQIPEIKVLATGEDPAYYIMRRAIAMAPYYRKQVSKYSCKVYLKGSGVFEKIPFLFEKQMKKGGLKENEPFVMETLSLIDFEQPDQVKQKVLAMRSSGKDNNTSPMGMITNNLYDADKYGMVSPVGKNAMKTYKFSLVGVFEDQGRTINKIMVRPKFTSNDAFSGYIYIADEFWNIHSADLNLHLQMTDVQVHQVYGEVNKNTFMPVSLDFDMDFSGLGFKVKYRYVASISEYKTTLNPALDHSFLEKLKEQQLADQQLIESFASDNTPIQERAKNKTKAQEQIDELIKKAELSNRETVKLNRLIEKEAQRNSPPEPLEIKSSVQVSPKQVNNDSDYWTSLRPIPLTDSERISFAGKDSFLLVSSTPEFQDSVRNSKRKFKIRHLLFGKTYDYSIDSIKKQKRFSIPNLTDPTSLAFNSVDGLRLELPFNYSVSDSSGRLTRLTPEFAYAFARKKMDASFTYQHRLNGITNSWISVSGGTTTSDFNRTNGLSGLTNSFYTLWLEENYKRFYRRDFVQVMIRRDLINGLNMNVMLDYSGNSPLNNHSDYSFINYEEKHILPNIPVNRTIESDQLNQHQSFIGRLEIDYTPRNRYLIKDHTKIYAGSKFPTYSLIYRGGFSGVAGSDSRYDLLKLGIKQQINIGIDDHFSYQVCAGSFLNSTKVYFEDFQHFNTQSTAFMFSSFENSFRLLPFYEFSTRKSFLDAHGTWQSRRLILKQLPLLRNSSLLSEKLFVNVLSTPEINSYIESGYGINNLFMLLNIEAVAGFENGKFRSAGLKFSVNLK
jgi:hypothetical protein